MSFKHLISKEVDEALKVISESLYHDVKKRTTKLWWLFYEQSSETGNNTYTDNQ